MTLVILPSSVGKAPEREQPCVEMYLVVRCGWWVVGGGWWVVGGGWWVEGGGERWLAGRAFGVKSGHRWQMIGGRSKVQGEVGWGGGGAWAASNVRYELHEIAQLRRYRGGQAIQL